MTWLIAIASLAGLVLLLVLIMAVVGAALPARHVAAGSAYFDASREAVFDAIADPAGYPSWRADVKRIELLPAAGGKRGFREHGASGTVAFVIDEERRPERLITRIADERLPFGGSWTYELAADGSGTRLTITENGFVKNVVFRFMSRFFFSPTATIEKFLVALERRLAQS